MTAQSLHLIWPYTITFYSLFFSLVKQFRNEPTIAISFVMLHVHWHTCVNEIHVNLYRVVSFRNAAEFCELTVTLSRCQGGDKRKGTGVAANLCRWKCFMRTNSSVTPRNIAGYKRPMNPADLNGRRFAGISTGIAYHSIINLASRLSLGLLSNRSQALRACVYWLTTL